MMAANDDQRVKILQSLLTLSTDLSSIRSQLAPLPWDVEEALVVLTPDHLRTILERRIAGDLSSVEVEDWANLIEGRDDIGFDDEHASKLRAVVHELANPLLTRELTVETARDLISIL